MRREVAYKELRDKKSEGLRTICNEIRVRVPWAKSIILIGSQAIGSADENVGDYDIVVVLKSILVPIFYYRLKKMEREVNARYDCKVSINPLPTFRLKPARDNYFLFKLAKRGIILWGEDFRPRITAGRFWVADYALVSYLSFLAKELIENLEPLFQYDRPIDYRRVLYHEKKVFMGCAEASLLMHGIYEDRPSKIADLLEQEKSIFPKGLDDDLSTTFAARNSSGLDTTRLWFKARNHILRLLSAVLRRKDLGAYNTDSIQESVLRYVLKSKASPMRNLQYFILSALNRKKVNFSMLFTIKNVTSRLYASVIMLLAATEENGINEEFLIIAYKLLGLDTSSLHKLDSLEAWVTAREHILNVWQLVDVHMGFR